MGRDFIMEKMKENFILKPDRDFIESVRHTDPELMLSAMPETIVTLIGMKNYVRGLPQQEMKRYVDEYISISEVLVGVSRC